MHTDTGYTHTHTRTHTHTHTNAIDRLTFDFMIIASRSDSAANAAIRSAPPSSSEISSPCSIAICRAVAMVTTPACNAQRQQKPVRLARVATLCHAPAQRTTTSSFVGLVPTGQAWQQKLTKKRSGTSTSKHGVTKHGLTELPHHSNFPSCHPCYVCHRSNRQQLPCKGQQ